MKSYFFVLLSICTIGCKTDNLFLDKFNTVEIDSINLNLCSFKEKIEDPYDDIILNGLVVNEDVRINSEVYFYGNKSKLNDDHYLITYGKKFRTSYKQKFFLLNWFNLYIAIYNCKNDQIISRLKLVTKDDPYWNTFNCKDNNYEIKHRFSEFYYDEFKDEYILNKDSILIKYKIEDNKFIPILPNH